jgi:hypothetical protein
MTEWLSMNLKGKGQQLGHEESRATVRIKHFEEETSDLRDIESLLIRDLLHVHHAHNVRALQTHRFR